MLSVVEKYEIVFYSNESEGNTAFGVFVCGLVKGSNVIKFLKFFYETKLKISSLLYMTSNELFQQLYGIKKILNKNIKKLKAWFIFMRKHLIN